MEFEWDPAKAETNLVLHGVSFDFATSVFKDALAIEVLDDRMDYGEDRYIIIGMAEGHVLLYVAFTEHDETIRIISARCVTRYEEENYVRQFS